MAMTATIALSKSTVLVNQPTMASVTVSNSSGSPVNMLGIQPIVTVTGSSPVQNVGAAGLGVVDLGPGTNVTVPAGGSLVFTFGVVAFFPSTGLLGTGSGTYSVSAQCSSADGSNFAPTAATLTVNNPAFDPTER